MPSGRQGLVGLKAVLGIINPPAVEVVEIGLILVVGGFLELGGQRAFWAPLAPGIGKASCCSVLYKK